MTKVDFLALATGMDVYDYDSKSVVELENLEWFVNASEGMDIEECGWNLNACNWPDDDERVGRRVFRLIPLVDGKRNTLDEWDVVLSRRLEDEYLEAGKAYMREYEVFKVLYGVWKVTGDWGTMEELTLQAKSMGRLLAASNEIRRLWGKGDEKHKPEVVEFLWNLGMR